MLFCIWQPLQPHRVIGLWMLNEVIYCHGIRGFKKGEHIEGLQNDSACGFNEH